MMLYSISKFLAKALAKILLRLEVKGRSNIPRVGGFILASNHASFLDPIVLGVACPRRLNFMARHDLFNIPVFGAFIRRVGAFPLKRDYADIGSIKEALRRLGQAVGLVLFPEGSRAFGGSAEKAQPGVGFIAAKSHTPVVPAFIDGTGKAFGRGARFIRPTKVRVYFGKPVYVNNSGLKNNYAEFAMKIIQEIKRLSQERGNIKDD
jgi:1-acyl-sn-glycerol-3-phosphate acyltransferase